MLTQFYFAGIVWLVTDFPVIGPLGDDYNEEWNPDL